MKGTVLMRQRVRRLLLVLTIAAVSCALLVGTAPAHGDRIYGAFAVQGRIEQAYLGTGGPAAWGNPTTAESPAARGGRFQRFANNTSFYWHPQVSNGRAHHVGGTIRARWASLNWERGPLGYPTNNEQPHPESPTPGVRANDFQNGAIFWSARTGARPVWGEIFNTWVRAGATRSTYGLPISDEYRIGNRFAQNYQRGTILWP